MRGLLPMRHSNWFRAGRKAHDRLALEKPQTSKTEVCATWLPVPGLGEDRIA